jgi:alpha-tubulin suppressor-like RCC1 family protein
MSAGMFLAACTSPTPPDTDRLYLRQSAITVVVSELLQVGALLDHEGEIHQWPASTPRPWPDGLEPIWSSSNATVVSISPDGALRGESEGFATITVVVGDERDTTMVRVTLSGAAPPEFLRIAPGGAHACALDSSGAAYCWGVNGVGETGYGNARRFTLTVSPVRVAGNLTFMGLAVNGGHACALDTSGAAFCWGDNSQGAVGDGTRTTRSAPAAAATSQRFSSITAGIDHSCALTAAGVAYCWGSNGFRQLGLGSSVLVPTAVATDLRFAALEAGGDFTCGLVSDGRVYCWGSNAGQTLGLASTVATSATPTLIDSPVPFASISAGHRHVCGLTAGGDGYCWGSNGIGELGTGESVTSRATPGPVDGGHFFKNISAGNQHSCAVAVDDTAWCWGNNLEGANGNDGPVEQRSPVAVNTGLKFLSMFAGKSGAFSCGLSLSGQGYCWGSNVSGQLGIGRFSETDPSLRIVRTPRPLAPTF